MGRVGAGRQDRAISRGGREAGGPGCREMSRNTEKMPRGVALSEHETRATWRQNYHANGNNADG
jgi:hypothetical protein